MSAINWDLWGVLAGGFCVLSIYSFLWKENRFYRFFEHVYIGVATGYGVVETISNFVWPDWLKPSLGLDLQPWESYQWWKAYLFVAAAIGLLMYFMLSRKHNWIARIVIGLGLGIAGGMAFQGFFGGFFPTLVDSFRPVVAHSFDPATGAPRLNWWLMGGNVLFLATMLCVMTYFFFSFEHSKPGIKQASAMGRWLMMVTFGAFFGSTVMARMALLIDRLQFMIHDWYRAIGSAFGG
ncbi:MAG TPA: hypothetical protein PK280_03990 [Planctomycetota bacterium]|nr:hypothetical protein [Planctomycetota bacterium]